MSKLEDDYSDESTEELGEITESEVRSFIKRCLSSRNSQGRVDFVYTLLTAVDADMSNKDMLNYLETSNSMTL